MSDDMWEGIGQLADASGVTRSDVVRSAVAELLVTELDWSATTG